MEAQQPRCPLAAVDLLHCRGGPEAPCNDGLDARIHAAHSNVHKQNTKGRRTNTTSVFGRWQP